MALFLKQNDTRPIVNFVLTTGGTATDLTGVTYARLLMRAGAVVKTIAGVVLAGTGGTVQVTFGITDLATVGTYEAEIETTRGLGAVETFPNGADGNNYFTINVIDDIG